MSMASQPAERAGVGVLGGSGYIGAELLRYLTIHPRVTLAWTTANTRVGERVDQVLPNLRGFGSQVFIAMEEARNRLSETRVVFVSLPHNESQSVIPSLAAGRPGTLFIDMGGDFRTNDPAGYERFYGTRHAAPEWIERFVYGFTQYRREKIRGARLIANPGCFATSLNLSLAPLAAAGRLRGDVCITGITGSSGSGNKPAQTTHHPERATNVKAYKSLVHQHVLEVEGFLRMLTRESFRLHFVPQSGPFVRGIFSTLFVPGMGVKETEALYQAAYGSEPLISVIRGSPDLRWVQGTPRSFLGIDGTAGESVVFCALDNLGKGAAGQAIENMNLAMGFEDLDGLLLPGGFV